MIDYQEIKEICEANSEAISDLTDRLLYYAASRDHREAKLDRELAKYKSALRALDISNVRSFQAQYFTHCVFKKGGLINQYVNHRAFNDLSELDRAFLDHAIKYPWRFSYSEIINQPADAFFEMQDVFTEEKFLLYSPGVKVGLEEGPVSLWYNLIAFNGSCWQSYGPIGNFSGFEGGDIHYFTSLLYPNKWPLDGNDIMDCVEKNPVPYFALMSKMNLPLVVSRGHQVIQVKAVYDYDVFDADAVSSLFTIETKKKVHQLKLKDWDEIPHFATIYFDESIREMHLLAMTEDGFSALTTAICQCGYEVSHVPDFAVNPTMVSSAEKILKKKTDFDIYSKLFQEKRSKSEEEGLEKMNGVLSLIIPEINAGIKPDARSIASEAGLDVQLVEDLIDDLWKKVGR